MKTALVQTDIVWENKQANFEDVRNHLKDTSFPKGGLIVLPELFATGFTMNASGIAEDDLGETEAFLIALAEEKNAHVVGGVAKNAPSEQLPFNCSVMVSPNDGIIGRYQKIHPFSLGDEDKNYSKGKRIDTLTVENIQITPAICYDLRFPELFRIGSKNGAEIYVVIANWPEKRNQHWITLLQARAIENQAYVIGVNRCGEDPILSYAGSSLVVDYLGYIVADAKDKAGVIESELNITGLREWRDGFPALRDRRTFLSA